MSWTLLDYELLWREKTSRYLKEASDARRVRDAAASQDVAPGATGIVKHPNPVRPIVRALLPRSVEGRDRAGNRGGNAA